MVRYVMLLKFTPEGLANIRESPARKDSFAADVARYGGQVEEVYWTLGEFDAVCKSGAEVDHAELRVGLLPFGDHAKVLEQRQRLFQSLGQPLCASRC